MRKLTIVLLAPLFLAACFLAAHRDAVAQEAQAVEGDWSEAAVGATLRLPAAPEDGGMTLVETLRRRRSVRAYAPTPLTREEISSLLWAAQGITEPARGLRTAPSAGALYPLELYIVTPDGIFRYNPAAHDVTKVRSGDRRAALAQACLGQQSVAHSGASIVFAGVHARTTVKYGQRSARYVDFEAGAASQNVLLQAVALDLATVVVGAFTDDAVAAVLGNPQGQRPLIVIPVGHPAQPR